MPPHSHNTRSASKLASARNARPNIRPVNGRGDTGSNVNVTLKSKKIFSQKHSSSATTEFSKRSKQGKKTKEVTDLVSISQLKVINNTADIRKPPSMTSANLFEMCQRCGLNCVKRLSKTRRVFQLPALCDTCQKEVKPVSNSEEEKNQLEIHKANMKAVAARIRDELMNYKDRSQNSPSTSTAGGAGHLSIEPPRCFLCSACSRVFPNKTSFFEHMLVMHPDMQIRSKHDASRPPPQELDQPNWCRKCDKHFARKSYLQGHWRKFHSRLSELRGVPLNVDLPSQKVYQCQECDLAIASRSDLLLHLLSCHPDSKCLYEDFFVCPECKFLFSCRRLLTWHRNRIHKTQATIYQCDLCKVYSCPSKFYLQEHIILHMQPQLVKHFRGDSSKLKRTGLFHICRLCKRRYSNKQNLRNHEKIHLPIKKVKTTFKCKTCERSFIDKAACSEHVLQAHLQKSGSIRNQAPSTPSSAAAVINGATEFNQSISSERAYTNAEEFQTSKSHSPSPQDESAVLGGYLKFKLFKKCLTCGKQFLEKLNLTSGGISGTCSACEETNAPAVCQSCGEVVETPTESCRVCTLKARKMIGRHYGRKQVPSRSPRSEQLCPLGKDGNVSGNANTKALQKDMASKLLGIVHRAQQLH